MEPGKLVYIRFYDHFTEDEVENLDSIRPTVCEVVGWLIKEDDKYYYVSNWVSRDVKTVYDISGILKSTVIEFRELKLSGNT